MAETICPSCGFSPIPDDVDDCPKCRKPFAEVKRPSRAAIDRLKEDVHTESTTFGGVTGAVTAHPTAPAIVLALGALIWFLRASGVLSASPEPEPPWLYGLVGLELVMVVVLFANVGPARLLAQLTALIHVAVAVALSGGELFH